MVVGIFIEFLIFIEDYIILMRVFEGGFFQRLFVKGRKWDQEVLWQGRLRRVMVLELEGFGFKF